MTITYPLTFPTAVGLVNSNLTLRASNSMSESPFSFVQQVYNWQGARWEIQGELPLMNRDTAEQYMSFFASLNGRFGTFLMYVPSARTVRTDYLDVQKNLTTISGNQLTTISGDHIVTSVSEPYCKAGTVGSKSLTISGLRASVNSILLAGDYFHIGSGATTRLYKILKTVNSNANGELTLDITPPLRRNIVFGEKIYLNNPLGLFRLNSNVTEYPSDMNNLFSISFSAVEAINGS
jgi:hypothetical protein